MTQDKVQATYDAICDELGRARERLPAHAYGRSFRIDAGGVPVTVMHSPERGEDCLLVMANLGPLPEPEEEAQLAALLDFNFRAMAMVSGVTSSRNPDSGDVFLQYALPLEACDAKGFLARLWAVTACAPASELVARHSAQGLRSAH